MLVHITDQRRIASIMQHGIVCPRRAAELAGRGVFGSRGSNREVVQLLDLGGESAELIRMNLVAMVDDALANEGTTDGTQLVVLVLADELRTNPAFVSCRSVAERARGCGDAGFRYVAHLEAWYEGRVEWANVRDSIDFPDFLSQLRHRLPRR